MPKNEDELLIKKIELTDPIDKAEFIKDPVI
jgi:hypothetical protein